MRVKYKLALSMTECGVDAEENVSMQRLGTKGEKDCESFNFMKCAVN